MKPYYQDNHCTIYHGAAEEFLPDLAVEDRFMDLVLTDPPYGIGEAAGKNRSRVSAAAPRDYGYATWDNEKISRHLLKLVVLSGRHAILFGGNYYADNLPASMCWLVWDKENTGDFADSELAWTNLPGAVRNIRWRWNGMLQRVKEERWHPTQKPLGVMRWCIRQADEKTGRKIETILDPFMGSGTTLRAAKD